MDSVILFLCLFTAKFREITFTQHNIRHPRGLRIRDNGGDGLNGWVIAGTLAGVFSVVVAVVGAIIGFMQWRGRGVSLDDPHLVMRQPLVDHSLQLHYTATSNSRIASGESQRSQAIKYFRC